MQPQRGGKGHEQKKERLRASSENTDSDPLAGNYALRNTRRVKPLRLGSLGYRKELQWPRASTPTNYVPSDSS